MHTHHLDRVLVALEFADRAARAATVDHACERRTAFDENTQNRAERAAFHALAAAGAILAMDHRALRRPAAQSLDREAFAALIAYRIVETYDRARTAIDARRRIDAMLSVGSSDDRVCRTHCDAAAATAA